MGKKKLLVIGKQPPPIGGVTIHVQRLVENLKLINYQFDYANLDLKFLIVSLFRLYKYTCVHIHSSNPLIRFYLVLLCRLLGRKSIVTIHGNIGRFKSEFKNCLDRSTIKLAFKPIVLNTGSYEKAILWNKNTELISAFIPPQIEREYLSEGTEVSIKYLKENYQVVFCTNAYNLAYDKDGNEIYGILELVEAFKENSSCALVISDPSCAYREYFGKEMEQPNNICLINGSHSFFKVMNLCDASVRNTSTDGDALSVKESLYLHKPTFVTNVVERPLGCILYKRGQFGTVLDNLMKMDENGVIEDISNLNGFTQLSQLYTKYIN